MCVETRQSYDCGCSTILYHICAAHIAHTHKQLDNNPCPHNRVVSAPGPRRCQDACEGRKDSFYSFDTEGESLFQRTRRVNTEWEAERKQREEERKKKEAAVVAYGMGIGGMNKGKPQLLPKNFAENDDRGGKRVKRENNTDVVVKMEETDEIEMGDGGGDDEVEMKTEDVD